MGEVYTAADVWVCSEASGLLASEQAQERRLAVTVIEDVRNGKGSSLPRRFDVPPVNFEAQCLEELIGWKTVPAKEPDGGSEDLPGPAPQCSSYVAKPFPKVWSDL